MSGLEIECGIVRVRALYNMIKMLCPDHSVTFLTVASPKHCTRSLHQNSHLVPVGT